VRSQISSRLQTHFTFQDLQASSAELVSSAEPAPPEPEAAPPASSAEPVSSAEPAAPEPADDSIESPFGSTTSGDLADGNNLVGTANRRLWGRHQKKKVALGSECESEGDQSSIITKAIDDLYIASARLRHFEN
jgi:hypothetical protein